MQMKETYWSNLLKPHPFPTQHLKKVVCHEHNILPFRVQTPKYQSLPNPEKPLKNSSWHLDFKQRHIKGATPHVVDQDLGVKECFRRSTRCNQKEVEEQGTTNNEQGTTTTTTTHFRVSLTCCAPRTLESRP